VVILKKALDAPVQFLYFGPQATLGALFYLINADFRIFSAKKLYQISTGYPKKVRHNTVYFDVGCLEYLVNPSLVISQTLTVFFPASPQLPPVANRFLGNKAASQKPYP